MRILLVHDCSNALPEEALALRPAAVGSEEEARLAYELARRSFAAGRNIAKKFKYEFLLWLTGKTDIKSALALSAPVAGGSCLVVIFNDAAIKGAKPAKLRKKAAPLDLERISLSRVKN